jgi:hypothetical protein
MCRLRATAFVAAAVLYLIFASPFKFCSEAPPNLRRVTIFHQTGNMRSRACHDWNFYIPLIRTSYLSEKFTSQLEFFLQEFKFVGDRTMEVLPASKICFLRIFGQF